MSGGDKDSSVSTKIDPSSPYFVGQNDKPGDHITDVRLDLTNFDAWSYSVRTALKDRRKYGFLNDAINEPKPPCTLEDWEIVQSLLVSWLMNTITPEVKSLLTNYEDAKLLWDDLHERFDIIDGPRIQQIQSNLHECRQTETMSVAVYYGKLCQLWDELDKFEPIITCHDRSMCFDLMKELPDWWYELKGIKNPFRGGSGRGGGANRDGSCRGGGSLGSSRGEGSKSEPKQEPNNVVHAAAVDGKAKEDVTVYGTPHHDYAVWIYLLCMKTEVHEKFLQFVAMILRQFSVVIKTVRSDNGTELHCLQPYFKEQCILFQSSCVGTPQQNGRVERKHQHILNVARALRFQAALPIQFWGECAFAAAHLINRTPSVLLGGITPYEVLFNSPPPFDRLKVFGSLCYAHNQRAKSDKFSSLSRKCIFMGYLSGKKGWYSYDLDTREFFVSRDVTFYEDYFPYRDGFSSVNEPKSKKDDGLIIDWDADDVRETVSPAHGNGQPRDTQVLDIDDDVRTDVSADASTDVGAAGGDTGVGSGTVAADMGGSSDVVTEPVLGRGHRTKIPNSNLRDYVVEITVRGNNSPASNRITVTPSLSGTPYSLVHYVNSDKFSAEHRTYLTAITSNKEPRSFKEAVNDEGWRKPMETEMNAVANNETWTLELRTISSRKESTR
ncbi:uncharacterized protein LOC141643537 [Silene latifolia]|uniref:uncharacterized protein LOC141643537 n=1 Tax=Silene latifolia TaxID=37657 RepID=UPI003D788F5D